MILADTSAWIEFDRASGSPVDLRLSLLISTTDAVRVTEPVIMELLMGARSDDRADALRRMLSAFPLVACDPAVDFAAAARVYRQCRRRGVTPRGAVDCLIAAIARRTGCALLTGDRDLVAISHVMDIAVDGASG